MIDIVIPYEMARSAAVVGVGMIENCRQFSKDYEAK